MVLLEDERVAAANAALVQHVDGLVIHTDRRDHGPDRVAQFSSMSHALGCAAPFASAGRMLDLGTGSGILALLAARAGMHATGVDINPRAIAVAAGNALRNGLQADWREGDWFAPVAGERFDLVLSNPPFVLAPSRSVLTRDGDPQLAPSLLRAMAAHLTRNGVGLIACEWPVAAGDHWSELPAAWARELPCDVVALRCLSVSLDRHARTWAQPEDEAAWRSHLRGLGAEHVAMGLVAVRPSQRPRFAAITGDGLPSSDCGTGVVALLDAVHWTLDGPLVPAQGVRVTQSLRRDGSRWASGLARVRPAGGLPVHVDLTREELDLFLNLEAVGTVPEEHAETFGALLRLALIQPVDSERQDAHA